MSVHRAVVRNGRLVLDEPSSLPEGTEVPLIEPEPYANLDESDLDDAERAKLDAAIERGLADVRAGRTIPLEKFLQELDQL